MANDLKSQLGKFEGSWVHECDENYDKFLAATGESEVSIKHLTSLKPRSVVSIEGGQLHTISQPMPTEMPDFKFDINFKMDEPFDWKYKNQFVDMDLKITAKMLDGRVKYDVVSQNNKDREHTVLMEIIDGRLVETFTVGNVVGKRFFKRE